MKPVIIPEKKPDIDLFVIMKNNDGYVYVRLSRCKSFDHFFVPQCYHCYKFNYSADECPDKDIPATSGKRAGRHKT